MTSPASLTAQPLFGIAVTLILYGLSLKAAKRFPNLHPVLFCSICLIALLLLFRVPYEDYNNGGRWITLLLGPATVALAVPLYTHRQRIFRQWRPIIAGVVAGTACSMALNASLVQLFGGDQTLLLSLLSKSTTVPVSIELTRLLGGVPELAAVFTVLTGIFGSVVASWFLYRIGVRGDLEIGIAVGTAAHGIGTGRILQTSELQGAYSGLAMALTALILSVMSVPVYVLIGLMK